MVHPALWPARPSSASPVPDPSATNAFVDELLSRMSLEEKVAQMIQADIASLTPEDLRTYKLGALLAGGGSAPEQNPRSPPQAWLQLADSLYKSAMLQASNTHQSIPPLLGIDAVHGDAKVRGATIFPHNIGLGATHDAALIERIGRATGEEVASTGFDWSFGPTVAVARDVRWGRSYESYSDDATLVSTCARAMILGLQGELGTSGFMSPGHTLSSVKHFLGDGGTAGGRDQGDNRASERTLIQVHAAPYPAAFDAGALIVMASYSSWQGVKMHANYELLTTVLKDRFGFDGFVVGDWNAQEEVPGCTKFSCAIAIRAGLDMFMAPDSWKQILHNTVLQVRAGEIAQTRIDDAVRRILRVKTIAGLFARNAPSERPDAGHFERLGSPDHRALAREAVRKSLVLLKNNGGTLPLSPKSRILVTGEGADRIDMQSGGWTVDWQGDHNHNADFPGATSIFEGIRGAVAAAGGTATLSRDGHITGHPDAAVVVFGETPYAEYEGDLENVDYSSRYPQSLVLLKALRARGIPTVAVFLSGRPLWVNPEMNAADAFVAGWLPGSEGAGVADVLIGGADGKPRFDFTGHLSFPWPNAAMPVTYDHEDRPQGQLFARNYGLTYAHPASVPSLPEEAHLPADLDVPGGLFHAGHPTAPWSMFVADALAQVRVTTQHQDSPQQAVHVTLGNGPAQVVWSAATRGDFWIGGRPVDLRGAARRHEVIRARLRSERPVAGTVQVGLRCAQSSQAADSGCGIAGGAMLDITSTIRSLQPGHWVTVSLPLACFAQRSADLSDVAAPFALSATGEAAITISDVRMARGPLQGCEPRIEQK
ncbi:MAG: glycoside hydrolase family 3 C-terminal domain-containing protein [Sinobacteraceae bacterium]|nr:glycoside hydrolase family 3 C-terminal domain-containing protein [Nevskiaceae bacterium]